MKYFLRIFMTICAVAPYSYAAQAASPSCVSQRYHEYDFWLGQWEVSSPALGQIGVNHLTPILNGCAVLEEWSGADGSSGKGLIVYSRDDGKWRESYVDDHGDGVESLGGPLNGVMTMEYLKSETAGQKERLRWQVIGLNEVHQIREISTDGGEHWVENFRAIYTRKK